MTLEEFRTAISEFRQKVRDYRALMVRSRDNVMPEIVRNGQEVAQMRTELNEDFGRLQRYIQKFSNNPRMNDGVNPVVYAAYPNAFSNDILLRVGRSTDAVLQDLDYIIGQLNGITENEFRNTMNPPQQENNLPQPTRNYWHMTNPIWWLWKIVRLIWKHKVVSLLIALVGLLAIDYSLAWRNALWIRDFVLSFF